MQTRRVQTLVMGALLAAPVVFGSASSSAWRHDLDAPLTYFIPGPPPGPELGLCRVETRLIPETEPVAMIQPLRNGPGACKPGARGATAQIVSFDGVGLVNGPIRHSTDDWPATSVGPAGHGLFGAHFSAANVFGYTHAWSVGVFE